MMSDEIRIIWCLVVDDALRPMGQVFCVEAMPSDDICTLEKIIIARRKDLSLETVTNLSLWKLSDDFQLWSGPPATLKSHLKELCFDPESDTEVNNKAVWLKPSSTVREEFSGLLPSQRVHVLVRLPPREDRDIDVRPLKRRKTAGEKVQSYFQTFPAEPPSQAGKPEFFLSQIQKQSPKVHCNRPFELTNIPIALLHPVFGQFRDSAKTIKPSLKDNRTHLALIDMMLKHYPDDAGRRIAFHRFFLQHLSQQLHAGSPTGTESQTGGHGFANSGSFPSFIHIITAVKNELTENSTDPYFQVTLLFKDYLKSFPSHIFSRTVFPVMAVLVFGCYLQIAGMIMTTNGIQIEPLSPAFALFADPYDEDHRLMVTRCLAALREALSTLQCYYKSLSPSEDSINYKIFEGMTDKGVPFTFLPPSGIPPQEYPSEGYPYVTSYKPFAEPSVAKEIKYLWRPYETKLQFLAQHNEDPLFIKFTRRYSKEVHLLLSDRGFAPELLGFETLPGGWFMVVMKSLQNSHMSLSIVAPKDRERYRKNIERIVSCLHENGFVHGDLTSGNIIVSKSDDGVVLVDFDEAGQEGTALYPPNLNNVDITRPKSVIDGTLIRKEDDEFMFLRLFHPNDITATISQ